MEADHHRRLLEGMTHAAARYGYAGASVARVIEHAGVSRATFYEHFADRQQCFLSAYRAIMDSGQLAAAAAADSCSPPERSRIVLEAILRWLAGDPAAARLVLIEVYGVRGPIRIEHERRIADRERSIDCFLGDASVHPRTVQIPVTALVGGVLGVVSGAVLRGECHSIPLLLGPLLDWIDLYVLPPGEERWSSERWEGMGSAIRCPSEHISEAPVPAPFLPRGRNALPRTSVAAARRDRIIEATTRLMAENGYADTSVADLTSAAHVTRGAFYSHFGSKQDAFLAAQMVGLQESIAAAAAGFSVGATWPERVWGGLAAFLRYLGEHPDAAYLGIAEVEAAGEEATLRARKYRVAFALFLEEGYRQRSEAIPRPALCFEAIAGAIFALLRRQLFAGRADRMLEVLPQCAYVSLAPFIGPVSAGEFVDAKLRADVQAV